jgi:beta-aspartyl-peptidase (threonine type)
MSSGIPSLRGLGAFVGLLCLALLVTHDSARLTEPIAEDDSIKQIRDVLARQQSDWNKGDLDAFLTGYWNSPKVVFQSGGHRYDGWEAMRDRYRKRYQAEGKAMGRLSFSSIEIELLAPEAALVRGGWRLTLPDGSHPGGLFTLIFRKFSDGWKIVHDHTSAEESSDVKKD